MPYDLFHRSRAQDDALDAVIRCASSAGTDGVVALDLDGCLFDNRHRQVRIARVWADQSDDVRLSKLSIDDFQDWSFLNTLAGLGIDPAEANRIFEAFQPFWVQAFFSDDYVCHDLPAPGASRFARDVAATGARVTYLTGRGHAQRPSTLDNLRRYGFPIDDEGVALMTKPSEQMGDAEWKRMGFAALSLESQVVGFVDNEPIHVRYAAETFPDAAVVWTQTDHSPGAEPPGESVLRIRGFLRTSNEV
ncbi:MAG: hypothetical protein AB8H79_20365 [Myxococcota bacterium]